MNGATPHDHQDKVEALIVGAGLSGLYALYRLRKNGIEAKIFEASDELGGVWNYNRYPGARVDSECPYYQYSIPEVYRSWNFTERFAGQEELLQYLRHVATVLDLYDHIVFRQNVIGCDFDTSTKKWGIKTEENRVIQCKYLVVAGGSSYKQYYPTFKGLEEYQGDLFHASSFPREGYDFTGKQVAIIGQGATGIQITQEVSKKAAKLTVFVRTPNLALPMRQRKLSPEEQHQWKSVYDKLFELSRCSWTGFPFTWDPSPAKAVPEAEREAKWNETWSRGGFSFNLGSYGDYFFDQESNDLMYDFWKRKTRERITDPEKAEIFAPEVPPHPVGGKRPSLEQDYYECIDRSNVEAVDLKKTKIETFDKDGIQTSDDKHRKFDVIILATGYDAITGSFTSMGLRDVNGLDMKDKWKDGVRTYLGMTVPGFPNMFMMYSPQAPTALSNGTTTIEGQGDWIAEVIVKMKEEQLDVIEPESAAAEKWADEVQDMNSKTLLPLANSWYMGANIPGKKREQLNYLGGIELYRKVCNESKENWGGFIISTAAQPVT